MAVRTAMLVAALLVSPAFSKRIMTEELMKAATDRTLREAVEHMVEQDQNELAEASAAEEMQEGRTAKAEEDSAHEAVIALAGGAGTPPTKRKETERGRTTNAKTAPKGKTGGNSKDEGKRKPTRKVVKEQGEDKNKDKSKGKLTRDASELVPRDVSRLLTITRVSYMRGEFNGFIYAEFLATQTLIIKCWKAVEEFGKEAVIPIASNSVGARVGDRISFDVEDLVRWDNYKGKPSPKATNVVIHPRGITFNQPFTDSSGFLTMSPLAFLHAQFSGYIYQEIAETKTLLIACWKAREEFGGEAVIPLWGNEVGVKVGDEISFDVETLVQEGDGKPRPMAINLFIRSRGYGKDNSEVPALADVCTQIMYYISDESLRTNKFFQDIIATSEGGWISIKTLRGCKRIRKLGATTKSIMKCLQSAPGIEVRNTHGQEAVRRTNPLFRQWNGTMALPTVARQSAIVPVQAKKIYTKEMMELLGIAENDEKDLEEFVEAAGPEADEQEHPVANSMDDTSSEMKLVSDLAATQIVSQNQEDGGRRRDEEQGRRREAEGARGCRGGAAGRAGKKKAAMQKADEEGRRAKDTVRGRTQAKQAAEDKRTDSAATAKALIEAKEAALTLELTELKGFVEYLEADEADEVALAKAAYEKAAEELALAKAEKVLYIKRLFAAEQAAERAAVEKAASLAKRSIEQNAEEAYPVSAEKAGLVARLEQDIPMIWRDADRWWMMERQRSSIKQDADNEKEAKIPTTEKQKPGSKKLKAHKNSRKH